MDLADVVDVGAAAAPVSRRLIPPPQLPRRLLRGTSLHRQRVLLVPDRPPPQIRHRPHLVRMQPHLPHPPIRI